MSLMPSLSLVAKGNNSCIDAFCPSLLLQSYVFLCCCSFVVVVVFAVVLFVWVFWCVFFCIFFVVVILCLFDVFCFVLFCLDFLLLFLGGVSFLLFFHVVAVLAIVNNDSHKSSLGYAQIKDHTGL